MVELRCVPVLAGLAVGAAAGVDRGRVRGVVIVLGGSRVARIGRVAWLVAVGFVGGSLRADAVGLVVAEHDQRSLRHPEAGLLGDQVGELDPEVVPVVAHRRERAQVADHRVERRDRGGESVERDVGAGVERERLQ